jgi:hypothetical protein
LEKENAAQFENTDNKSSITDNTDIVQNQISENKEQDNTGEDINLARDRTFNKELSDLVTRIRSNEPQEKTEPKTPKEITDDELLRLYHKLYYKAVNLAGVEKINSDLNPFELYKESSSDDLTNLIYAEMNNLQMEDFAILVYNLEKKCYISYTNHINDLKENNIIIDSLEGLYTNILVNKNGIVLDHQSIERNLYLKKRFGLNKSIYFISFNSFFKDFYNDADFDKKNDFPDYLLPILLIQLKENIKEHQKNFIFNKIKNKLSVYFFLLYKKILLETQNYNNSSQQGLFNFIDYTYRKYSRYDDYLCCIIKLRNYINIEYLVIFKYFLIKLEKKLTDKTTISRIEKDKLIIFTQKSKKKILDDIVDDFNKLHGNIFNVRIIMNDENNKNNYTLRNIKEQMVK